MKYEMSVALGGVLHWGVNYVSSITSALQASDPIIRGRNELRESCKA